MDEFKNDLENNKRGNDERAVKFKLKNGDNNIVILTNPIGFSSVFGLGLVYEGCGYAQYAGRKYKCYLLDLTDNAVKMADFNYTDAQNLAALSEGAKTKFTGFPMPYSINLKTSKAGTKEVKTDILAMDDYVVPEPVLKQLEAYSPIQEVIDNLKKWQKKQNEENPEMAGKISAYVAKREKEVAERQAKANKDSKMGESTVQIDPDYPDDLPEGLGTAPF